jgi:hypothetical protein
MMEERSGSMGLAPQEKLRDSKRMMCQPYGKLTLFLQTFAPARFLETHK